jgi:hypothetical protein
MHNQCKANAVAFTFCGLFVTDAEVGHSISRHVCSIDHHAQGLFEVDRPLNSVVVCGAIYGNLQNIHIFDFKVVVSHNSLYYNSLDYSHHSSGAACSFANIP